MNNQTEEEFISYCYSLLEGEEEKQQNSYLYSKREEEEESYEGLVNQLYSLYN